MVNPLINTKFMDAVEFTLKNEGGYVNHPNDPGGETNFGITKRSYPYLDISKIKKEDAINIYYKDFWERFNYHLINNSTIRKKVFDMGILMGPKNSIEMFQTALSKFYPTLNIDSRIGNITSRCANELEFDKFYPHLLDTYWSYFENIIKERPKSKVFEKGWRKRVYS